MRFTGTAVVGPSVKGKAIPLNYIEWN